jgi:hypothetical protein
MTGRICNSQKKVEIGLEEGRIIDILEYMLSMKGYSCVSVWTSSGAAHQAYSLYPPLSHFSTQPLINR